MQFFKSMMSSQQSGKCRKTIKNEMAIVVLEMCGQILGDERSISNLCQSCLMLETSAGSDRDSCETDVFI